jgi:RHS repeat-associated protein
VQFGYDGNGQRVQSTINGETILFVGGYYEKKGSEITKYYPGGAMRKYVIPQSISVEYTLGDHLGSASVMTDAAGNKVSEMRYNPWGQVRYSWVDPNLSTTPAYTLPKHTFTGQYSYMDDPSTQGVDGFGLMFYNARFYDPQVGRFSQADTIVPGGVQGLDRYAYVNNNPANYTDPSGHTIQGRCNWMKNYDCIIYGPTAKSLAAKAAWSAWVAAIAAVAAATAAAAAEQIDCLRHPLTCDPGITPQPGATLKPPQPPTPPTPAISCNPNSTDICYKGPIPDNLRAQLEAAGVDPKFLEKVTLVVYDKAPWWDLDCRGAAGHADGTTIYICSSAYFDPNRVNGYLVHELVHVRQYLETRFYWFDFRFKNIKVTPQAGTVTKAGTKGVLAKARRRADNAFCPFLRAVET